MTNKELVQKCLPSAKCAKCSKRRRQYFTVTAGDQVCGKGRTPRGAWEEAAALVTLLRLGAAMGWHKNPPQ